MADELLRIAAARELKRTDPVVPPEGIYQEFAARFPYAETEDQLRAIEDVLDALQSGKQMDRLGCGDVHFGKQEVAVRVALVAGIPAVPVAVVVPTPPLS